MRYEDVLILVLASSATASTLVKRDTCHKSNDSIGKYCAFQTQAAWQQAASLYCTQFEYGLTVPAGASYGIKIQDLPDGKGGKQIFWGNWKVESGGSLYITRGDCIDQMNAIYDSCGGYGGWMNTKWGTVFGECIKQ